MTTNQDRAAQLLYNEGCGSGDTAHYIARRLAGAGLLTPELPEPDGEWIDADKLRKTLARLDREYATVATSNPRPGRDEYTAGYLAGIDTAHKWLTQALEGTHE